MGIYWFCLQSGKVLAGEKYDSIKTSFFDVETRKYACQDETIKQKECNYIVEGEEFDIFINNLQCDNQYQASHPGESSTTFEDSFNNELADKTMDKILLLVSLLRI